jgi:hypothetical protein
MREMRDEYARDMALAIFCAYVDPLSRTGLMRFEHVGGGGAGGADRRCWRRRHSLTRSRSECYRSTSLIGAIKVSTAIEATMVAKSR